LRQAVATSDSYVIAARSERATGQEPIAGYRLVQFLGRGGFGTHNEGPDYLPAEIVRVDRRADGYREVGARFAFGGFHAGIG
jgi:hypothetical protein